MKELQIFLYYTDTGRINLSLCRQIMSVSSRSARANLVSNSVHFSYLGRDFDNSYTALAGISSLQEVFLRGQFGQNSRQAGIQTYCNDEWCLFHAYKVSFKNGKYPHLKLVGLDEKESATLSIANVHQFHAALHKAMSWIAPEPQWNTPTQGI